MNCAHGIGKITKCPDGLAFNEDTYQCDWPDQVEDCNAEAFLNFTCPSIEKTENSNAELHKKTDDIRYYRHPKTCKRYFVCVNGRPRLYTCSQFLVYNAKINLCDSYTNVPECRRKSQKIIPIEDSELSKDSQKLISPLVKLVAPSV